MYKGEWQSTLSSRMVFNVVGGYGGYLADYAPWRSNFAAPAVKGNPARLDRITGLNTAPTRRRTSNIATSGSWTAASACSRNDRSAGSTSSRSARRSTGARIASAGACIRLVITR